MSQSLAVSYRKFGHSLQSEGKFVASLQFQPDEFYVGPTCVLRGFRGSNFSSHKALCQGNLASNEVEAILVVCLSENDSQRLKERRKRGLVKEIQMR